MFSNIFPLLGIFLLKFDMGCLLWLCKISLVFGHFVNGEETIKNPAYMGDTKSLDRCGQ